MENKTSIVIKKDMANKLNRYKYEFGFKSVNEVLEAILKLVPIKKMKS